MFNKNIILTINFFIFLLANFNASAQITEKGIYITQSTLENTKYLTYLIKEAKDAGINTFIVDIIRKTPKYEQNIKLVEENNIKYVARIVVFPEGGLPEQVLSQEYRQKKYALAEQAVNLGAKEIQLDYIRYKSSQPASKQNATDIYNVIKWFKDRLKSRNVLLQIDVFGISAFKESPHIGQNLPLFSELIDALCPMVYPSHFAPYEKYSKIPYETIYKALAALRFQFNGYLPFKLYPYIELSNYHYKFSKEQKLQYIYEQIKAAEDSNADGWYAWSPSNYYDNLFLAIRIFHL